MGITIYEICIHVVGQKVISKIIIYRVLLITASFVPHLWIIYAAANPTQTLILALTF